MTKTYFQLEQVADGVYTAIVIDGAGALGNAGFVDLGGATLVFDTFLIPQAGEALRQAAEEITGNPVKYVVNSHWHGDHVLGNQAFPDAVVISTEITRELILQYTQVEPETDIPEYEAYLKHQEKRMAEETDPRIRRSIELDILDKRELLQAMPFTKTVAPTVTFTDHLTLRGSKRRVELLTYGGGHTLSDAVLYLPEDGILFAADLILHNVHPWAGAGQPHEWLTILDKLEQLDFHTVVPGHGPVGREGKAHVPPIRRYITDLLTALHDLQTRGASPEDAGQIAIPADYAEWEFAEGYRNNLRALLSRD